MNLLNRPADDQSAPGTALTHRRTAAATMLSDAERSDAVRSDAERSDAERVVQPQRFDRGQIDRRDSANKALIGATLPNPVEFRSTISSLSSSLRGIGRGDHGVLSAGQADAIGSVLRQVESLHTLLRPHPSATRPAGIVPNVIREGTARFAVERSVTAATAPLVTTREIELLWDGSNEASGLVFADQHALASLLTGIVEELSRDSRADRRDKPLPILIRMADDPQAGLVRWSVVVARSGATDSIESSPRESHWESLRQLATWMFSSLTIRSQRGRGSEVSFETPAMTPASIATVFAKFRLSFLTPVTRPAATHRPSTVAGQSDQRAAIFRRMDWTGAPPRRVDRAAMGRVDLPVETLLETADHVHRLLHATLSPFELVYRTGRRSWAFCLDADHHIMPDRIARVESIVADRFPELRLVWGEPAVVPIGGRAFQSLLIDRLTTQSLVGTWVDVSEWSTPRDEVRLGTPPIASSPIAAARLDEEIRRLSERMRQQSSQFQQQAKRLRPPLDRQSIGHGAGL